MSLTSWGNYPKVKNQVLCFDDKSKLAQILDEYDNLIAYGNGRSYGDSALNTNIVTVKAHNYFLDFDETNGLLHIQAGVLLSEILSVCVPRGWFLKVTPGTKLITVGGAIASDVHGKNHHIAGCFSECLHMFNLMLPDGKIVKCSKKQNSELYHATCGGMGLTGIILDAKIALKKINSQYLNQTTIKTKNLKETFAAFDKYKDKAYSVAWIDSLAKGKELGRCLLMLGDFCDDGKLDYQTKSKWSVPCNFPSLFLNTLSIRLFNFLYYKKVRQKISRQKVDIDTFFYPLDKIDNWNRIYGKNGFIQYQFILPLAASFEGLKEVLSLISASGKGSFLAVLKLHGAANNNYLSFPMEGYSLALDFKMQKGLFKLLDSLDEVVMKHSGRIYLAKDARVKKEVFEQGYPQVEKFRALRKKHGMNKKFNSLQSQRIGI